MKILKLVFKYLLALFFVGAGINHFLNPDFYLNIMPDYIPAHRAMVLISGVTEIIGGVLLAIPKFSRIGAWSIVAMLIAFMPVHVDMIVHSEEYASIPLPALYFRIVLQGIFILWAWWFTRPDRTANEQAEVAVV